MNFGFKGLINNLPAVEVFDSNPSRVAGYTEKDFSLTLLSAQVCVGLEP
jgi:hypothetical protein